MKMNTKVKNDILDSDCFFFILHILDTRSRSSIESLPIIITQTVLWYSPFEILLKRLCGVLSVFKLEPSEIAKYNELAFNTAVVISDMMVLFSVQRAMLNLNFTDIRHQSNEIGKKCPTNIDFLCLVSVPK